MFNRYIPSPVPPWPRAGQKGSSRVSGGAEDKGLFGGKLKLPKINADTLILLVLAYFLVADSGDEKPRPELILILGVLLILGF